MLKDDFYKLTDVKELGENEYDAFIKLNKEHAIFKGHFPGRPIVPGVCMIQIVKELVSQITNLNLALKSSTNIKFTALIDPEKTPDLKLNLLLEKREDDILRVKNISYFGTTDAVKMVLDYRKL